MGKRGSMVISNENNAIYSDIIALVDLDELVAYMYKVNLLLFENKVVDAVIIGIIANCIETIKDINIMSKHSDEYDTIVKIESIKNLLTVHQELLEVMKSGNCDIIEEINEILYKLTLLYPMLLVGYALEA